MTKSLHLADPKALTDVVIYLDYRDYLRALYLAIKKHREKYSYTQFAEDLGFSKTNVIYLMIIGKRPLTLRSAQRISQSLGFSELRKRYFELLVRFQNSRNAKEREDHFRELLTVRSSTMSPVDTKTQLEVFTEWYHPVTIPSAGVC